MARNQRHEWLGVADEEHLIILFLGMVQIKVTLKWPKQMKQQCISQKSVTLSRRQFEPCQPLQQLRPSPRYLAPVFSLCWFFGTDPKHNLSKYPGVCHDVIISPSPAETNRKTHFCYDHCITIGSSWKVMPKTVTRSLWCRHEETKKDFLINKQQFKIQMCQL